MTNDEKEKMAPGSTLRILSGHKYKAAGGPEFEHLLPAYRNLIEDLWKAETVYNLAEDGGLQGCKVACHAVARFLAVRDEAPEIAAPILAIHQAFCDLEDSIDPELFSRSTEPRPRSRSRERKHAQLIASACMGALMMCRDSQEHSLKFSADRVARYVSKWACMDDVPVDGTTIRNWRDQISSELEGRRKQYDVIVEDLMSKENPRREIDKLLKKGPPGISHS